MNFKFFKKKKKKSRRKQVKIEKIEQKSQIKENLLKFKQWFRKYKKTDDYSAIIEVTGSIFCYGIPISAISSFIQGAGFTMFLIGIIPLGLFMVLFDKKLLAMVCQLFSSIRLVEVKR